LIGVERHRDAAAAAATASTNPLEEAAAVPISSSALKPPVPSSKPVTAAVSSRTGTHTRAATASDAAELATEGGQGLSKEEEDFLKMEAMFITELGLDTDALPNFAK
jgi:hypothetical protein